MIFPFHSAAKGSDLSTDDSTLVLLLLLLLLPRLEPIGSSIRPRVVAEGENLRLFALSFRFFCLGKRISAIAKTAQRNRPMDARNSTVTSPVYINLKAARCLHTRYKRDIRKLEAGPTSHRIILAK